MILKIQLRMNYFVKCYHFTKTKHPLSNRPSPPTNGESLDPLCLALILLCLFFTLFNNHKSIVIKLWLDPL